MTLLACLSSANNIHASFKTSSSVVELGERFLVVVAAGPPLPEVTPLAPPTDDDAALFSSMLSVESSSGPCCCCCCAEEVEAEAAPELEVVVVAEAPLVAALEPLTGPEEDNDFPTLSSMSILCCFDGRGQLSKPSGIINGL